MEIGTLQTKEYGALTIEVGRYPKGGAVYVRLMCDDGEPANTFSTNLVPSAGVDLARNEFNVRSWADGQLFLSAMMATGLFEDTGRRIATGFVSSPVWKIVQDRHVPPSLAGQGAGAS